MSDERMFPVLAGSDWREYQQLGMPRAVPWRLLGTHEAQALLNHGQTLQRLAERGGLSPFEMRAIVKGLGLRAAYMTPAEEYAWLVAWLAENAKPETQTTTGGKRE